SEQSQPLGYHRQLRERADLKLLHEAVAVHLDRPLRDTERVSDLLMALAADQQVEDLALTGGQTGHKRAHCGDPAIPFADLAMPCDCTGDSSQQFLLAYRLGQKVVGAGLDRLNGRRYVAVAGNENDWKPA